MSSNETINCLNFSNTEYEVLIGLRVGISIISLVCCLLVLALIVLLKRYLFFIHRLVMYLMIAALLNSVVRSINVYPPQIAWNESNIWEDYCKVVGFFDQYTMWCVLLAVVCITLDIFVRSSCECKTYKIEPVYVAIIFFLPALFNWVPFILDGYGYTGVWCWIRGANLSNCSKFENGLTMRLALIEVPQLVIMPVLVLLIIITFVFLYQNRYRYEGKFDPHQQMRKRKDRMEVLPFLYYPIVLILLEIFPVIHTLYDIAWYGDPRFVLWVLNVLTGPFEGAAISLIYLLEPETRQRLSWSHIRAAAREWCSRNRMIREYPADLEESGDSRCSSIQTHDTDTLVTDYQSMEENYEEN